MFNINLFYENEGIVYLNKWKVVVRCYSDTTKTDFADDTYYLNDEGLRELEEQDIAKHQLLELVSKEELDISDHLWVNGIKLRSENPVKEIEEIVSYGSLEAYQASLPEFADNYMLELESRVSIMELGLN